jgi:PAS domain S-box-containing protein
MGEDEMDRRLRLIVRNWGFIYLGFVLLVIWLPTKTTLAGSQVFLWIATYAIYLAVLEVLSRVARRLYDSTLFRLFRIHFNLVMIALLALIAPPTASGYLWFFFLAPLAVMIGYFGPSAWLLLVSLEICVAMLILTLAQGRPTPLSLATMAAKDAILGLLAAVLYFFVHLSPRGREASKLLEAGMTLMQGFNQDELVQHLADVARTGIPAAEAAVVHLVGGENKQMLVPVAASNLDLAMLGRSPMELGKGIAGHAIQSREAKNVPDVDSGDHSHLFAPSSREFKSLLVAPMYVGRKNVGTISVHSARKNVFSQGDERFLRTLAAQGATAIANADSYKKLTEERNLLHTLINNLPDYIYAKDAEGRFVIANVAVAHQKGFSSSDEVIGKSDFDIFPPELAEQYHDDEQKIIQSGQGLYNHEGPTIDASKEEENRWVSTTKVPLRGTRGEITGFVGLGRDITDRRMAEEALRQRNRELELLYQVGQTLASTLEMNRVLDTVLEAARGLLGVVAASLWLIDPATGELLCQQAVTPQSEIVRGWRLAPGVGIAGWVVQHGESQIVPDAQVDKRHYKGVDEQTGLEVRSLLCVPLRARQRVIGALEVMDTRVGCFKTTDLRLIEPLAATAAIAIVNAQLYGEAKELSTFNANIVQSMDEGIILEDAGARITFVNPRTTELLGYTPEELKGQHCTVIVMPEEKAKVEAEIARRSLGVPNRYETVLRTKSGQPVPVIVSGTPLYNGQGNLTGSLCAYTDITDRKQQETRLQEYLSTVTSNLARHTSLEGLYQFIVETGGRFLSARDCSLFLVSKEDSHVLELVAATAPLPEAGGPQLAMNGSPGCGLVARAAATCQPIRLTGAGIPQHSSWNEEQWRGLGWDFDPQVTHSLLAVPMRLHGGQLVGVLVARDAVGREGFSEFDETLLGTLATTAAADIERVKSVVKAREEGVQAERKRLEADLHEAMNMLATGVRWEAEILAEEMERGNLPAARIALRRLQAARTRAYTDLHYLLEDLRDPTLEREGLLASLKKRAELIGHGRITVLGDSWEQLPPKVEGILYRVGQEAMDNAAKHSGVVDEFGVKIEAWLERSDKQVRLCVRDNGVGFDVESTLALSHKWGLRRLCDTVHEMGGRLEITSAPGEGTMITATIDLARGNHER